MSPLQLNSLRPFFYNTSSFPKRALSVRKTDPVVRTSSNIVSQTFHDPVTTGRRSANYMPNIWDHDFMRTLKNEFTGEVHVSKANTLRKEVKHLLDQMQDEKGPLAVLEFIDDIERLGLGYIFEQEILRVLRFITKYDIMGLESLHATSLYFRLSRMHGLNVSPDIFIAFIDEQDKFMEHLSEDVIGVLSLYEASHFGIEGEDILDEAKIFAHRHLKSINAHKDQNLFELVNHSLDLPLNFRILRLEARWFIDVYSRRKDANPYLLKLAKLGYNMVQGIHQVDAIAMSQWWENLGLPSKLPFTRDRLVECFLWSVGVAYEPQYKYCREGITKLCILLTTIDDIYDIYATLDEAKLFTNAVERWDVDAIEHLPDYMKISFLALYNTINEIAYKALKKHDLNIFPYLRKMWADQCNSFLLEAEWFYSGYKPTLQEYLDNACISLGGPLVLFHTYFLMCSEISNEALQYLASYPNVVRSSSLILRLTNDMGTSKAELERGDILKSVQCYMHEKGATEEVAREYIRYLTDKSWKKMNEELLTDSPLPREFIKLVANWGRTAETTYQYGDGHGIPDQETKERVLSLLVESIL